MNSALLTSIGVVLLSALYLLHRLRVQSSSARRDAEAAAEKTRYEECDARLSEATKQLRKRLVEGLAGSVIGPEDHAKFKQLINAYWAQQTCEVVSACVVQPRNVQELSLAVKILKMEYDNRKKEKIPSGGDVEGFFAIRSGGHSPVSCASSVKGGVLIDLSLFDEVTLVDGRNSVIIGAGCKWMQVSKELEKQDCAVAGGRNSAVGVGGLTLGGGLSFFSPRYGFVCSNILEYEIVLADGTIAMASATKNPDLWRALKGGSNNFGIVTRFTARSFPCANIWSGFLYMHSSQAHKVLSAFHEFLNRVILKDKDKPYDKFAAGPLACFTHLQQIGIEAIAVALTHTQEPENKKKWPVCWENSGFSKLWRFWSTCSVKKLTAATDEMSVLNPPGRRQKFATTTIKNDGATLEAVYQAYRDAIVKIRKHNIKEMSWTLVLQPLLPDWARKGSENVLGLESCADQPLVNISFTVNWALSQDDGAVHQITRAAIEQIDAFAQKHGTWHRYRYLNYCDSWQRPFDGYGEDNLEFLREVSRKYDGSGLFQQACVGGFKLEG